MKTSKAARKCRFFVFIKASGILGLAKGRLDSSCLFGVDAELHAANHIKLNKLFEKSILVIKILFQIEKLTSSRMCGSVQFLKATENKAIAKNADGISRAGSHSDTLPFQQVGRACTANLTLK